jgi:hypothetical protein
MPAAVGSLQIRAPGGAGEANGKASFDRLGDD